MELEEQEQVMAIKLDKDRQRIVRDIFISVAPDGGLKLFFQAFMTALMQLLICNDELALN